MTGAGAAGTAPRARPRFRVVAGAAVVVGVAVTCASWWSGHHGHSSFYTMVEEDRSWLGYLPTSRAVDVDLAGLDEETSSSGPIRRVDLVEPSQHRVVSLCFAPSSRTLRELCPGFRPLGRTDRDVDLRVVGQLGDDSVDWVDVLGPRTPALGDVEYLDE